MQELTRICDLNGNAEKGELGPVAPATNNLDQLLPNIKLEHDPDLECWLPTPEHPQLRLDLNSTRLLLQGSDDPLISHGATNDAHDEDHPFKTLLARKSAGHETPHNGTCSPLTKQQLKANLLMGSRKANRQPAQEQPPTAVPQKTVRPVHSQGQHRSRKRGDAGAMKLRFHHQALPAEYAAHYEATQGRQQARPVLPPPAPPPSQAHENVRSWLRKIAEIQRNAERQHQKQSSAPRVGAPTSRSSPIAATSVVPTKNPEVTTASKRNSLKYADLPYMGEITLDNYKPRRGRKPKKADICHLIYKNYGTIVPASVPAMPLVESCSLGGLPVPLETIEKDNQLSLKIPIPSGFFANDTTPLAMRKRKRSAIFIPPMPAEHSSSPSNEVSICKFKFTGGAKPTLQEKKMLSVDAEGNYRYYNGTGDKTMRGYEFISRDQQQQLQQHQQPAQEKLYVDIPAPSTDLSPELLHISPESPTSTLLLPSHNHIVAAVAPHSPASHCSSSQSPMPGAICPGHTQSKSSSESERKRRSSRRSKQREKLEKTFKEKGFLIQTQQLQSAEGATYCKFRQLKKFTRYLFRNWKDHIPESDLAKHQSASREDRLPSLETQTANQTT
ncbi:GD12652 [Drosophila simulans]|uniref:GD12652 n=1 Tax=Drosophila simulans TaxID=7240 RepID=B4QJG6_DROSI|nr:GD12652 [Drosophila simulans]